ncbi:ABC transporter permease [Actinacidiphila yeochonensis]|uniref:DUF3533 domain-containing protein n=1 Tax=Actinacidiphila yeochonensis TaxID=89050 RepID=UPI003898EE3E
MDGDQRGVPAEGDPDLPAEGDPDRPQGLLREFQDAVTTRSALLVLGVMALGVLFIASYAGAFHHPVPKGITLGVVAPAGASGRLVAELDSLPGHPVAPHAVDSAAEARRRIRDRDLYGALVVSPRGRTDQLLVAAGGGPPAAQALQQIATRVAAAQRPARAVTTLDLAPVGSGDFHGLSSFYLVVGWCVGGYLCASILAVSYGARPVNLRRAIMRLAVLAGYAISSGLLGAVVIGPILGALPGGVVPLWWLGALTVFAVGAATFAFQGLAGVIGIGLTILVVVIAGNPSAGGAYPYPLLPPFWRAIGPALPPGAGTWSARSIAYFGGRGLLGPMLVLGAWALCGTVVTLAAAVFGGRVRPVVPPEAASAV